MLFIQEHFSFHSKRFPFAQDTAITVRSGGIKSEYAFFLQSFDFISVCIFYFRAATLLDLRMLFAPRLVAISANQKQIGKGASSG
jgi:hypothetical protein